MDLYSGILRDMRRCSKPGVFWFAFRTGLVAMIFFGFATAQGRVRDDKSWGEPVNGLQISIYPDQDTTTGSSTRFRVELRNVGKDEVEPVVGARWPDGETLYAATLILTTSHGASYRLFSEPRYVKADDVVNLVIAQLLVPIPPGAELFAVRLPLGYSFSLPIDLNNYKYFSDATGVHTLELLPNKFTLQANLIGQSSNRFWSGTAVSNVLLVVSPRKSGAK